jgi:exodeoxyribonuclease III
MPEEREWVQNIWIMGLWMPIPSFYPERKVQYTWWTYRLNARARGIGWRLDYFLVSEGAACHGEGCGHP